MIRMIVLSKVLCAWTAEAATILLALLVFLASPAWATTRVAADCQVASVNTQIAASSAGDTVTIPAGNCTWTTAATALNGVTLTGAGSPRITGRSTTTVTLGTGAKTFTVTPLSNIAFSATAGDTLNIYRLGDRGQFMLGTVTSYVAPTLVMNITSSGSASNLCSGKACPPNLWLIMQTCTANMTCLTHNVAAGASMFTLKENASFRTQWSNIKIIAGTGTGTVIQMAYAANGKAMLVHDCWIESNQKANILIESNTNRGVISRCSFDSSPFYGSQLGLDLRGNPVDPWLSPSTMGTADTTGENNLYVEDTDHHAFLNFYDTGDSGKLVVRYSTFNHAALGTHGPDTGPIGQRHFEAYNNDFIFNRYSDGTTLPLARTFYIRGGTFVITDNSYTTTSGNDYMLAGIDMTIMNLQRNSGPNPCWGANVGGGGALYPAPRQVGFGRVTGAAGNDPSGEYKGDIEPAYIWGNTGTAFPVGTSDFGGVDCTKPDSTRNYVVAGRDYFADGTARPGYTKYSYPHPLTRSMLPAPSGLRIQ